jgi:hypothetical protein
LHDLGFLALPPLPSHHFFFTPPHFTATTPCSESCTSPLLPLPDHCCREAIICRGPYTSVYRVVRCRILGHGPKSVEPEP